MKVLISAYACEPFKGSEPGAGWNWSLAAARDHEVWVLTRANNREVIETELARRPVPGLHIDYVDLPAALTRWKKGQRGVRLYYTMWQIAALRRSRRLHSRIGFDAVHHLTFANMWLPALTCFLDAPFVFGPVGGGPRIPLRHYGELGWRGGVHEVMREFARTVSGLSPLTRAAWRRATIIIAQNEETLRSFPSVHRSKTVIHPNASVPDSLVPAAHDETPRQDPPHRALFAGRLLPWKGVSIAIRALQTAPEWNLTIIGSGSDLRRLQEHVGRLDMAARVTFIRWIAREKLWRLIRDADVVVLPSLRDDSPLIVAEAQALGVPVVAFEQGGPREFARYPGSTVETVPLEEQDLAVSFGHALTRANNLRRRRNAEPYTGDAIATFLRETYLAATGSWDRG